MAQYELPQLPYDFNDLEPVISGEIMELHYSKHHRTYVTNLNAALEKQHEAEKKNDIAGMIAMQKAIRFNGGGHVNHSLFWALLAPPNSQSEKPQGKLAKAIESNFGSFEAFKEKFSNLTVGIQGSGWGWLGYNKDLNRLEMVACQNQDPLSTFGLIPILGIDVWEHAYYLQYKNVRTDYVKNIWKIFNWDFIEKSFEKSSH